MTTLVPLSTIGLHAFSNSLDADCDPSHFSPEQRDRWLSARSSWPRILTPSLYEQIDPYVLGLDTPRLPEETEPRWCKAWAKMYAAVSREEWCRVMWADECDRTRRRELGRVLFRRPWKMVHSVERTEWLETDGRIEARYRECTALAYLLTRYPTFEADRGVPNLQAVLARLEPFEEDEKPSFAEREERAKNWMVME